ncbi:MAG: hypothetical protein KAH22_07040 [Thiotrichaceae bacterium]|nr:hypothetical protein [Thiotrichaceae bacterium]
MPYTKLLLLGFFTFIIASCSDNDAHTHNSNDGDHSHATEDTVKSDDKTLEATDNTEVTSPSETEAKVNVEQQDQKQTNEKDTITITIPAKGDKEYKLYLNKGASFDYTWKTDKEELFFDFHAEPEGDTTGYFKSFEKDTKSSVSGSLTTEFAGTHGWYWENKSTSPVVITLSVSGEYQRLDKPVSQEVAEKNAKKAINLLIKEGKVDKSWASIKVNTVDKKVADDRSEWVITYINKAIPDTEKQTLYVFLTLSGQSIAVNYTGK